MRGRLGTTIDCGGGYVIPTTPPPPTHAAPPAPPVHPATPAMIPYISTGPTGRCWAVGPAHPAPDVTVTIWQNSFHVGACIITTPPAAAAHHGPPQPPPPPPPNPAELALHYWQTIPLPAPHPSIPPGYAICGKQVYMVTHGTTNPAPFQYATPLGPLTIDAHGSYLVHWGDTNDPGWTGPYAFEGEPWPSGRIVHTYDNAGTVSVTVKEVWSASWNLGGDTGTLTGLATQADFAYPVYQLQAVVTQG